MAPPELVPCKEECEECQKPRDTSHVMVTFICIAVLCAVIGLLWVSPAFYPTANPEGLYRVTLDRAVTFLAGFLCMLLGFLVIDYATPGAWLRRVLNDTRAIGAVVCVVLYLLVQLFLG